MAMFVRMTKGQKVGVAIGNDNLYPGEAKSAGKWIEIKDTSSNKDVAKLLVDQGKLEIYAGEGAPPEEIPETKRTKGQRAIDKEAYKKMFKEQHWQHVVSYVKKQTNEQVVMDMYEAYVDADLRMDTQIAKAIRQQLESVQK